jgi:hypothetical protein
LRTLSTLYRIEDRFVRALGKLQSLLARTGTSISAKAYEQALGDFGSALKLFDGFDEGVNTVFAILDQLIRANGGESQRGSSLTLTSSVDGRQVRKMFMNVADRAVVAGSMN